MRELHSPSGQPSPGAPCGKGTSHCIDWEMKDTCDRLLQGKVVTEIPVACQLASYVNSLIPTVSSYSFFHNNFTESCELQQVYATVLRLIRAVPHFYKFEVSSMPPSISVPSCCIHSPLQCLHLPLPSVSMFRILYKDCFVCVFFIPLSKILPLL